MRVSIKRIIIMLLSFFAATAFVLSLSGISGGRNLYFELACSFMLQYTLAIAACAAAFVLLRLWKHSAACLFALIPSLVQILPLYVHNSSNGAPADSSLIRILMMNVHTSNQQYDSAANYINSKMPDILILEEIDDIWTNELYNTTRQFPHKLEIPRNDNFGIGLYSKIPLANIHELTITMAMIPSISATIGTGDNATTIIATHPLPPTDSSYFNFRNEQLNYLSAKRKDFSRHLIVAGDLNTTPWSWHFKHFINRTNLNNCRNGFGALTSWPVNIKYMQIPIDHCLVSEQIHVVSLEKGPDIGSDHYPLYVELEIPR